MAVRNDDFERAFKAKLPGSVLTEDGFSITLVLIRATAERSTDAAMALETM
jgi:hypothetical protein